MDPAIQQIIVDGRKIEQVPAKVYLALHKPAGILTTKMDPQGRRIVMDLLPKEYQRAGVFPVGRLDRDSEGLLLLTNDGEWAGLLVHPRHQLCKRYRVELERPLSSAEARQLEEGIWLDGKRTLPAKIRALREGGRKLVLELREGRNRQIRKMCRRLGHEVIHLARIAVGPIELGELPPGEWRPLRQEEVEEVRRTATPARSPRIE